LGARPQINPSTCLIGVDRVREKNGRATANQNATNIVIQSVPTGFHF
jgi:hypothetical protein